MNEPDLRQLLAGVQTGAVSLDQALAALRPEPPGDLSFARIDYQRTARKGSPEVVFCEGKTPEQAASIFARLAQHDGLALGQQDSKLGRIDLDPRQLVMMPHPHLPNAQIANGLFGAINLRQGLARDRPAIGDARRQAGHGGLVPG